MMDNVSHWSKFFEKTVEKCTKIVVEYTSCMSDTTVII